MQLVVDSKTQAVLAMGVGLQAGPGQTVVEITDEQHAAVQAAIATASVPAGGSYTVTIGADMTPSVSVLQPAPAALAAQKAALTAATAAATQKAQALAALKASANPDIQNLIVVLGL